MDLGWVRLESFHDRPISTGTFSPTAPTSSISTISPSLKPRFILAIGLITASFWAVFLLIVYVLHFVRRALRRGRPPPGLVLDATTNQPEANRTEFGIDEAIVQSMPNFAFSSLKGNKEGLECAICLGKYVDTDVLRLLSRCKHAFHIGCVDNWLLSHSNCPLCRCQVTAEDQLFADGTSSARRSLDIVLEQGSTPRCSLETGGFQILVQRDGTEEPSQRFPRSPLLPDNMPSDIGGAVGPTPLTDEVSSMLRRFSHRIVVLDVLTQHRWSNFVPADLLCLLKKQNLMAPPRISNSDTKNQNNNSNAKAAYGGMNDPEPGKGAYEGKNSLSGSNQRSMSEITGFQRYAGSNLNINASDGKLAQGSHLEKQDERSQKWLPIVKRTLSWIMGKERKQTTGSLECRKGLRHRVFI